MNIKPYFSIDIETTGLDIEKAQILEIGLVYDDGISNIEDLPTLSLIVDNGILTYGESFALGLNTSILEEIKNKGTRSDIVNLSSARFKVREFIDKYNKDKPSGVFYAGKNLASFDIPILKRNGFSLNDKRRYIDLGSVAFKEFGYIPCLDEINKKYGLPVVKHRALDDALNIVTLIRAML